MKEVVKVKARNEYYLTLIVKHENHYRVILHTYENEKIQTLYFDTQDEKLIKALNYLKEERNPIYLLNISAIVKNMEELNVYL